MKIIDLLNLIASGKQPPKCIKFRDEVYYYDGIDYVHEYMYESIKMTRHLMDNIALTEISLTFAEVEVIEND